MDLKQRLMLHLAKRTSGARPTGANRGVEYFSPHMLRDIGLHEQTLPAPDGPALRWL